MAVLLPMRRMQLNDGSTTYLGWVPLIAHFVVSIFFHHFRHAKQRHGFPWIYNIHGSSMGLRL